MAEVLKKESQPILYILMRTDLASMNPGKAIAQGAHAATAFEFKMAQLLQEPETNMSIYDLYMKWRHSTEQGFGTKIVLDAGDERSMNWTLSTAAGRTDTVVDIILDPTYPLRDGSVTHYLPLYTCGYIFTDKNVWAPAGSLHA